MATQRPHARREPPDPPLADSAILLRPPTEADIPAIAAACGDPELARWIPVPVPYRTADAQAFVEAAAEGWALGTASEFAVVERAGGTLVGMVGLHRGSVPGRASVGYWIAPQARGRGLATRAVRLVARWAFEDPTLERLELTTLVGNEASGRVALRSGFQREGILRRFASFRGQAVDAVIYAMIRDDVVDAGGDPPADVALGEESSPGTMAG
jgi:RimJ/RimL family protein N-acetyltransferase